MRQTETWCSISIVFPLHEIYRGPFSNPHTQKVRASFCSVHISCAATITDSPPTQTHSAYDNTVLFSLRYNTTNTSLSASLTVVEDVDPDFWSVCSELTWKLQRGRHPVFKQIYAAQNRHVHGRVYTPHRAPSEPIWFASPSLSNFPSKCIFEDKVQISRDRLEWLSGRPYGVGVSCTFTGLV